MRKTVSYLRRLRFVVVAFLLLMPAINTASFAQEKQPKVKVGEQAPEFVLKDQNGKEVSLEALVAKKPTALVFYRSADW